MAANDRKAHQSVEDITRDLLVAAYPEKGSSWIDEQVAAAGQRIDWAKHALPSPAAGARRLSDAVVNRAAPRRPSTPRVLIGVALTLIGLVVLESWSGNGLPRQPSARSVSAAC